MPNRISTSPRDWAKALGMVAVPMFGPDRSGEPGDTHAILLDGPRASLTFTVGDPDELLVIPEPLDWAWSTNVTRSLVMERSGRKVFTRRWDDPDTIREWDVPDESEVEQFLAAVGADPEPTAETVIQKLFRVFWTLRANIERLNGSDVDLIRSFNALLVWADAIRRQLIGGQSLRDLRTLREIVPLLHKRGMIDFGLKDLSSEAVRSFPAAPCLERSSIATPVRKSYSIQTSSSVTLLASSTKPLTFSL